MSFIQVSLSGQARYSGFKRANILHDRVTIAGLTVKISGFKMEKDEHIW